MSTGDHNKNHSESDSDENDSVTCSSALQNVIKRKDDTSTIDFDDEIMQGMTASYTEISFNTQSSEPDDSILEDNNISGCLQELEAGSGFYENKQEQDTKEYQESLDQCKKSDEILNERPSRLSFSSAADNDGGDAPRPKALSYLNQLNGTVTQEGNMVLFVAEDLENKIKLSSPVGKKDVELSFAGGVPGWGSPARLCRQSSADRFPMVDTSILNDLELEVGKIATSVDSLTENLAEILHSVSALTVDCLETYRDVVCKTCDAVDLNIKSMYQLMAKCEELSKSMKPIHKISQHIKEIKHFLDLLENATN